MRCENQYIHLLRKEPIELNHYLAGDWVSSSFLKMNWHLLGIIEQKYHFALMWRKWIFVTFTVSLIEVWIGIDFVLDFSPSQCEIKVIRLLSYIWGSLHFSRNHSWMFFVSVPGLACAIVKGNLEIVKFFFWIFTVVIIAFIYYFQDNQTYLERFLNHISNWDTLPVVAACSGCLVLHS